MRLIDADVFRKGMYHEAFETDSDLQKWDSGCWIRWKMLENHLQKTPTVDAVPVVRCKDCIHHAIVCEPNCLPRYFCTMSAKHEEVDIGFFCACGERSEYGNHH